MPKLRFTLATSMVTTHIEERFQGDHPRTVAIRQYLSDACSEFLRSGLADPKFVREITSGSDQKFWACISEALIAIRLQGKNFGRRETVGRGPDFLVMDGHRRVWIEVVCPEPANVPANWLESPMGEVVTFPHMEILLRWTSAIKAKAEGLVGNENGTQKGYLGAGVVAADDVYVIAVNGCRLRSGPFPALHGISQFPFAVEAVFPVGPYQLQIDRDTLKVIEHGHQHRPFVLNQNQAVVPATVFLEPRFKPISAVWAVDFNGGSAIGNSEPSAIVHNPNALNPLPLGFLPADAEYVATQEGECFVVSKIPA